MVSRRPVHGMKPALLWVKVNSVAEAGTKGHQVSKKGWKRIMMTKSTYKTNMMTMMLVLTVTAIAATNSAASEIVELDNGMTLTVYSAEEIRINSAVCDINLVAEESRFVSFDRDIVVAALAEMSGFETEMNVNVYLLPATPTLVASSFAKNNNIYLAPGTGSIPASTQAYIVTHEMGHVITALFMDYSTARWDAYMQLRGLDSELNGSAAGHADRAREILAEDFRFLFGGDLATSTGSIENHDLELPTEVNGLEELLSGFLAEKAMPESNIASASAYPNPCNPRTTIAMALPNGLQVNGSVRLSIYNIRGALVQTIDGGQVTGNSASVVWNGDNNRGEGVSSGRYIYVIQAGELMAKGAVTLVR